ncbi:hypothetical protein G6F70_007165 [Rhizopus microsporus]|nr:hypothetical protein G6F71_007595 [Rhizopus microsporus]KAG1196779.1 hypothetical protein G6F70_007165 [Rhizopus microsporus]KAG1208461.1 hypothetical protein G6F69_007197 [Rhizopus microsporus]KAG1229792.1 hypothetical protein G6F67_006906 [Rhizopus microsporus]KAG1261589.1 hypothetical protein G6F68_006573 [Rhizopus microsporus]
MEPDTISVFGRVLQDDTLNKINQTDNSTVIITPRYNTTGQTELKIGLLLPFSQKKDNLTAKIVWGGSSAIRMAINDINQQQMIPGAYITLIEKDSFPDTSVDQMSVTNAVYSSITLLQQGVIGVIGDISSSWTSLSALMSSTLGIPQCSFTANAIALSDKSQYKYFFRTIPTQVIIADVMLEFASKEGWKKLGVLYTDDPLGQQFYQRTIIQAGTMDIRITQHQPISVTEEEDSLNSALTNLTESGARIIMVAANPSSKIMIQARQLGLINNDYVWLLMGDTSEDLQKQIDIYNKNHTDHQINYATDFQGLFMFDSWLALYGYPPFEAFLDKWATLNPEAYPFAGYRNLSYYEGLAYSCMMVMAKGFGKLIQDSNNQTDQLLKLASGSLGDQLLPPIFNINYVGPEGPMVYDQNGDLTTGNYLVYNLQRGNKVTIGQSTGGNLNIISPPMFFDGSTQAPLDSPPSVALNPDFGSPIANVILIMSSCGIIFSIVCFIIVMMYRKHEVFKASSPTFCCLELIGFILTYISVTMMIGIPSATSCIVTPIAFSLGFLLVIGNMIAKNYRIYRIFNNIFITRNVITDTHLIRSVVAIVGLDMIILVVGLIVATPIPAKIEVSYSSHYWTCVVEDNSKKIVFLVLNTSYAACLLLFATFLAYKTRFAGKQYYRYSECKQMGLSVYNILFSALVGFAVIVNPLADFYTKYYIAVISMLWANTFSLLILFFPKIQAFYQYKLKEKRKRESEEKREQKSIFSFLQPDESTGAGELMNLEQILAVDGPVTGQRKPSAVSTASTATDGCKFIEVHEGEMPVRKVFRYFPYLSQWEMHHVMVFPWLGYFSHYSKDAKKGMVMSYTEATVYSARLEDYVLKIHGQGLYDMHIQLPTLTSLHTWHQCFNQRKPDCIDGAIKRKLSSTTNTAEEDQPNHHHTLLDSNISYNCLLQNEHQ